MTANLPVVEPANLHAPVLIVRGEYDGSATEEDLPDFFQKLPVPDRQFAVLPGMSHAVSPGTNRHLHWRVVRGFLEMPARPDAGKRA
jgi:pimeloyl-ACP methyl ester carboxylesterase